MSTIHNILTELEGMNLIKSIITQTSEKYYQITNIGEKTLSEIRSRCKSRMLSVLNLIFET